MRRAFIPSLDRVNDLLAYDRQSGNLTWRTSPSPAIKAGATAGTSDPNTGGIVVTLDGHRYQAHHLAWYIHNQRWPLRQVLFRDKNPYNTAIANLYSVEEVYSESAKAIYARRRRERRAQRRAELLEIANIRAAKATGIKPIDFDERHKKWTLRDPVDNRRIIRMFDTPEEAREFQRERDRIGMWLHNYNARFRLKPTDNFLRAGTEPEAETYAEIAELVAYDPETGHFYYRLNDSPRAQLRADFISTTGRRVVTLFGRYFSVAMLAWFLTYREWPKPKQIGWRDGNKENNRLANLYKVKK